MSASPAPKVFAIVPARGGSKGVPKKNIRHLAGHPLIAYSIAAAKLSPLIDRVIVSTDSQEIADIASRYGADVPFLRPAEFAKDSSPDREFMTHAIDWFKANENVVPDLWVHLRPSTPLRHPEHIESAIRAFQSDRSATSLRSAHECAESPFKWFKRSEDGYFAPIVDTMKLAETNLPRQKFAPIFIPNGYVDILSTQFLLSSDDLHGDKILSFETPACVEIDNARDMELLEWEITRQRSVLLDWLDERAFQSADGSK